MLILSRYSQACDGLLMYLYLDFTCICYWIWSVVQVMSLIQVIVNNAVSKIDCLPPSGQAADGSENQDTQKDSSTLEQNPGLEKNQSPCLEVPSSGLNNPVSQYDLLLQLPDSDLRNLCTILAHEG